MIWENSAWLWLILLIPFLVYGEFRFRDFYRKKREKYFSEKLFSRLADNQAVKTITVKKTFFYIATALFIIALAGPKIGSEIREVERDGVDLIIALDVSRSMHALDVRPNRLEKAKFEILRLLERLAGDRAGLVVFTSTAFFQTPLTNDYGAFRMFLDISGPELMPTQGTNFNNALRTAHEAFIDVRNQGSKAAQVLLLFSDGEDHGPDVSDALQKFVNDEIYIYSVGIGTPEGSNIPIFDPRTGDHIDFHRDPSGRVVTTRLETEILKKMASRTNGEFYEISRASQGLDGFINKLIQLERSSFATEEIIDYKNQYQYFAGIGLLLMLISLALPALPANKKSA